MSKKNDVPHVCKFCGVECLLSNVDRRVYDLSGELHVNNCPKRAKHYHEKALDDAETARQKQMEYYNRKGTETDDGRRLAEGFSIMDDFEESAIDADSE